MLVLKRIMFGVYAALCVNPANSHLTKLTSQLYEPEVLPAISADRMNNQ